MISIVEQPNEISLSRNPIIYKLQTNNYITTVGVKNWGYIYFDGPTSPGPTITFTWDDKVVTFSFASSLDNSGTKIRTRPGGMTVDVYAQTILLDDLKTNNALFNDFEIEYAVIFGASYGIKFTARQTGTRYNLDITHTGSLSTYFANGSQTAGVDQVIKDNFKIFIEIFISDSVMGGAFTKIASDDQIPDINNYAVFDIAYYLNKYLIAKKPEINYAYPEPYAYTSLRYYIRYGESYGNPSVDYLTKETSSVNTWVTLGGKDRINYPSSSFYNDHSVLKKSIQTTQPLTRYVSLDTPSTISFLNNTSGVKLKVKFYYSDNTNDETVMSELLYTKYGVLIFPTSYTYFKNNSLINLAKTLIKYEVTILNSGDGATSQTITYIVDYINYQYERYFIYLNSLGGYDLLRCTGPKENSPQISFDESKRIIPYNYTTDQAEDFVVNNLKNNWYKISTGYHNRAMIDSLEDFFLSSERYFISGNKYIPVIIATNKPTVPGDESQTFAIEFEYKNAFTDHSYTPN